MAIPIKVLICGSVEFADRDLIGSLVFSNLLSEFRRSEVCIIEGTARGADSIAGSLARLDGFAVAEFSANWTYYGKPAGVMRNGWMIKFMNPDIVYAFYTDKSTSRGTADTVKRAKKEGILTIEYDEKTRELEVT